MFMTEKFSTTHDGKFLISCQTNRESGKIGNVRQRELSMKTRCLGHQIQSNSERTPRFSFLCVVFLLSPLSPCVHYPLRMVYFLVSFVVNPTAAQALCRRRRGTLGGLPDGRPARPSAAGFLSSVCPTARATNARHFASACWLPWCFYVMMADFVREC